MRVVLNFIITFVIVTLFIQSGWITTGDVNPLVVAAVASIAINVVGLIVGILFMALACVTLGLGCILLPIFLFTSGLGTLWLLTTVLYPGDVFIVATNVQIAIMCLAMSCIRLPSVSSSTTES